MFCLDAKVKKGGYMKKLWLIVILLMVLSLNLFADDVIIGTGEIAHPFLFSSNSGYTRSAILYTASEIDKTGEITHLSWYVDSSCGVMMPIKIYAKMVTDESLIPTNWATLTNGATLLYDDDYIFSSTGWATIDITNFNYTGNNLLILCEQNYGGDGAGCSPSFRCSSASEKGLFVTSNDTPPTFTMTEFPMRPNIKLSFPNTIAPNAAIIGAPVNHDVDVSIFPTLSWSSSTGGTPSGYKIYLETVNPPTTLIADIGDLSYAPTTALVGETVYFWKVVPYNNIGEATNCPVWSFTTGVDPRHPVPFMQDFNASTAFPTDWVNYTDMSIAANHGNGGKGLYQNIHGMSPVNLVASFATCQIGPLPEASVIKFDYRFMAKLNYPDGEFYTLAEGDKMDVQISTNDGQTYETIYTIDMNNHINSTQFATPSIPLLGYEGQVVRIKFVTSTLETTHSDFFIDFDNISVSNNATLPVELSAFNTAILANNTVSINWTTQSENNLLGYHILRSNDDQVNNSMRITDDMLHATNTSTVSNYSYNDQDVVFDTTYYYWLQSVEMNGTYEMHGPIIATVNQAGYDLPDLILETAFNSIYPNPFNPTTTLSFSLAEKSDVNIKIFNVKGQLVKEINERALNEGMHNITWNGKDSYNQDCASGIYLFRLQAGKTVMMKKGMRDL